MIRRGISLTMAVASLIVYLQSQLESNDALFLFISSNLLVNIGIIGLASASVWLAFQDKFKTGRTYIVVVAAAIFLSLFGIIGLFSASLDTVLFSVIEPLDYVLFLEAGIVSGLCVLTYEHPPVSIKLPSLNMARLRQMASSLIVPVFPSRTHGSRAV